MSFGKFHAEAAEIGDAEFDPRFRSFLFLPYATWGEFDAFELLERGDERSSDCSCGSGGGAHAWRHPLHRSLRSAARCTALHRAGSRCGSGISPGGYQVLAMSFHRDQSRARGGTSLNLSCRLVDPSSAPLHARSGRLFGTAIATTDTTIAVSDD